jgi:hypothetical protein
MPSARAWNFPRWYPHLALAFTVFAAACSGGGGTKADAGGAGDGAAPGDPGQEIGAFLVQLDTSMAPPQTGFLGFVRSGWSPPNIVWPITAQDGPCKLVVPEIPFCNPTCMGSAICAEGGRCVAQPVARNAGQVRVRGLQTESGPQEIRMTAMGALMDYQLPTGLRLAYPPFSPDGRVELDADGGDVGAFSLSTRAIAPLDVPATGTPTVRRGAGFALRWTPPPTGATSVIQAVFDLSLHAGTKGKIECEVPDSGSLDISPSLMDKLLDLGTAGFPKVTVTRQSQASTAVASGKVRLAVLSEVLRELMIEGQTSCTEDAECPSGRTCDLDKLLCK